MVDRLEITSDPTPSEGPTDQEMAEKFENRNEEALKKQEEQQEQANASERPSWLQDKFDSPEDLAKAYSELEKKLGQPKEESKEEAPASEEQTKVEEAVEKAGLDIREVSQRYEDNGGELAEEDYQALEEAGYPKDYVDNYIEGQKALAREAQREIFSITEGEDNYTTMVQWASNNLSQEEIAAYDKAVNSNMTEAKMAVSGLYARYSQSNGREPNLISGNAASNQSDVYTSRVQLTRDMNSQEYKKDPSFRKQVEEKLARSNIL